MANVKEKILGHPMEAIPNSVGGIDLLVERDAGNLVRILTGSTGHSLEFWEELQEIATTSVALLQRTPPKEPSPECAGLLDRLKKALNPEELDELVHEMASKIGSAINNAGTEDQVEFLMEQGLTPEDIREEVYGKEGGFDA